ncbi:MAG: hypothetical protein ACJ72P_12855, partial [Nocardioides sp.]
KALDHLSNVGIRVIKASKDSTIESFRQLVPVLTELSNTGDNFAKSFNVFLTYPFVDDVVGRDPQVARNLHMGDYTNLSVKLDVALPVGGGGGGPDVPVPTTPAKLCKKLKDLPDNTPIGKLPKNLCKKAAAKIQKCLNKPSKKNCQGVPTAIIKSARRAFCKDRPNNPLCDLPPLPNPLPGGGGNPPVPGPGVPSIPGVPRAGYGPTASWSTKRGPTMRDLSRAYDPDLVALLIPGMVTR